MLLSSFTFAKAQGEEPILIGEEPILIIEELPVIEHRILGREMDTSMTYTIVEKMPKYPGGDAALMDFLRKNITYPPMERDNNIQGRVVVKFIVDVDGKIIEPQILKSVSPGMDKEALRVVSLLSNFEPGTQGGVPVKVYYSLPIVFALLDGFHIAGNKRDFFSPSMLDDKTFTKGWSLFKNGDYKEAIKNFNKVIAKHPTECEGYLGKALSLAKSGMKAEACKMFEKAEEYGSETAAVEKKKICK